MNPATGSGYFCDATHSTVVESSGTQLYDGSRTPAGPANAPLSSAPPSGSAFDCPSLRFGVPAANSDWTAANG
ncbi:hypothetical protein [Streptomyces sp. NPDC021224]|uniref:hypothetical protein n=1 Tax=unclassified Streptomyces TaxID=2593676 RepID=UPI0037B405B0